MALDNTNNRRLAIMPMLFVVLPLPDGVIDAVDRAHVAAMYQGHGATVGGTRRQRQIKSLIKRKRRRR